MQLQGWRRALRSSAAAAQSSSCSATAPTRLGAARPAHGPVICPSKSPPLLSRSLHENPYPTSSSSKPGSGPRAPFLSGPDRPSAAVQATRDSGRASSGPGFANPVDVVKRELGLQSNKLDAALKDKTEAAIETLGFRVTVGDVAAAAGVTIAQADSALKALAYDSLAALEVSGEGDVVYVFNSDFRSSLRNKSVLQRLRPVAAQVGNVIGYLARISFGTALVSSVVLVWLAITALLSARDRDRDDRGSGYYGRSSVHVWLDMTDLFYYFDPYYWRTSAQRRAAGEQMSFLEAIFSFVFGDGDPNFDYEERRWQMLGDVIRSKGGSVTAEEMAPYLDPPAPRSGTSAASSSSLYEDESFVLPALIKFGGETVVTEEGQLVYVFPSLQRSGTGAPFAALSSYQVPMENEFQLTAASPGQLVATIALGVANVVGVAVLGSMLMDPANRQLLVLQGLGFIMAMMPALKLYAAAFFAIPAVRWCVDTVRNQRIDARNEARALAADAVYISGDHKLAGKLKSARKLAQRRVLQRQDSIFSTNQEGAATKAAATKELDDWDTAMQARDNVRN